MQLLDVDRKGRRLEGDAVAGRHSEGDVIAGWGLEGTSFLEADAVAGR